MKSKRYSLSAGSLLFTIVPLLLLLLLLPLTDSGISSVIKTPTAATTTTNIAAAVSSAAAPSFPNEECVSYDPSNRKITIRCKSTLCSMLFILYSILQIKLKQSGFQQNNPLKIMEGMEFKSTSGTVQTNDCVTIYSAIKGEYQKVDERLPEE